ncbi:hypothetical protein PAECIP111802_04657 [Paenibacillus allorhizosphaerae]|uniref:S-layer protein n=2 Tax=Paenibacillus allorhizosphaerae TaxID=2849866 RepID=A0ABN7TPN0_9BACL|nr:stalk domain-containing protein [Paenibacillus allorhizosphaerae]CAG7650174.1 hypothetical protein PAECIP111802_04657 [Paenibacillus allorhizosphaerae]
MKHTNRLTKFVAMFCLALMLGCANLAFFAHEVRADSTYSYRTAPNDTIGVTRPTITYYFTTDLGMQPVAYSMYVNGKSVTVAYDGKGTLSYTPTQDLAPGEYKVDISITYAGYMPMEQSWKFTVAANALKQFQAATSEQQDGLSALNDYRTIYGLSPVKFNDMLNAGATAHAKYLEDNKVNQTKENRISLHDEEPGKPGFTGKKPIDRAKYFGYSVGGIGEDAALLKGAVKEAIDALFDAPYHRSPLLDPSIQEVGVGRVGNYTVILFGLTPASSSQLVVSPAPGDRFVPTDFDGYEAPDPLRMHSGATYPAGYPIMAQYFGTGIDKVKLVSAELLDSSNKPVDFLANSPDNDDSLTNAIILIPRKPLEADARYHVKLKLEAVKTDGTSTAETKEWDFTTEPVASLGKQKLHQNAADYKKYYVTAAPVERVAAFGLDDTNYKVDGIPFPMKRPPLIVDGFSYLYIRDLAAALGANVEWDNAKRAAVYTKGALKVTLYTNTNQYEINGTVKTTDTPARLIDENTMVPVRLLAEVLGAKVDYVEATRTVKIAY